MTKPFRHRAILELLQEPTFSQEELQKALSKRGFTVGQATLSRDIRELNLVKTTEGYVPAVDITAPDAAMPPVNRLVREFVAAVRIAQNLVVLKTTVGSAQPVAAALDSGNWPEQVGCVAGDDTILIVCSNHQAAKKLVKRIEEILD